MLGLLLFGFNFAFAQGGWSPLANSQRTDCNRSAPCRIFQDQESFEVSLETEFSNGQKHLKKLVIRRLRDNKVQEFSDLDSLASREETETYDLYKIQIRPSGQVDLALHASNSANEGEVYYYFFYASAQRKFVQSAEVFPQLIYDPKTDLYLSATRKTQFKIGSNLTIQNSNGTEPTL